ncbi:unnamed protein product, partial [Rotaria sp. Silwood1]
FSSQLYSRIQENNFNSLKHIHICSKYIPNHRVSYFPNANELTIEHYFKTADDSTSTILNRILFFNTIDEISYSKFSFFF